MIDELEVAVAVVIIVAASAFLLLRSSSTKGLVWSLLTLPVATVSGLGEMASFKLSSLVSARGGFGSLSEINWAEIQPNSSHDDSFDDSDDDDDDVRKASTSSSNSNRRLSVSAGNGLYYPGLLNAAGNLCFLNATLQSMASQPSLIRYLVALDREARDARLDMPVTATLLQTLDALNTPTRSPRPLRPVELASALAKSSRTRMQLLRSNDQQDAHELWIMIHEAVQEEVERLDSLSRKASEPAGLADVVITAAAAAAAKLPSLLLTNKRRTDRVDPYMLLTSQTIKCMICGYTRDLRHIAEDQIVLPVPFTSGCSLAQLLAEYTKPEVLTDYACRACCMRATQDKLHAQLDRLTNGDPSSSTTTAATTTTTMTSSRKERKRKVAKLVDRIDRIVRSGDFEHGLLGSSSGTAGINNNNSSSSSNDVGIKMEKVTGPAAKQVRFARAGDILTVHLNRSTHFGLGMGAGGAYKNTSAVSFPEYLDLAPFCDETAVDHRKKVHSESSSSSKADGKKNKKKTKSNTFTVVTSASKGKKHAALDHDPDLDLDLDQHDAEEEEEEEMVMDGIDHDSRTLYKLASLVVHYGTHSFGHYIAFRRAPDTTLIRTATATSTSSSSPSSSSRGSKSSNRWFRISDETVDECSIETVLASNPFLLFYERVRPQADRRTTGDRLQHHHHRGQKQPGPSTSTSTSTVRQGVGVEESKARDTVMRWHVLHGSTHLVA